MAAEKIVSKLELLNSRLGESTKRALDVVRVYINKELRFYLYRVLPINLSYFFGQVNSDQREMAIETIIQELKNKGWEVDISIRQGLTYIFISSGLAAG